MEAVVLTVRVVVPVPLAARLTLDELSDTLSPDAPGLTVAEIETVPTRPYKLPRLTVEVPFCPATRPKVEGSLIAKS